MDKKYKILAVDDEKEVLDGLKKLLEQEYEVETASDGDEALEKVDTFKPDLILCDLRMPKKDGLEVLKAVRMNRSRYIPFVMVTAVEEFDKAKKAYDDLAEQYITKPFNPYKLKLSIQSLLSPPEDQDNNN